LQKIQFPRVPGHEIAGVIDTLGADRVVMGTDYPFAMGVEDPVTDLDWIAEGQQIMGANAERFLGVKEA